MTRFLLVLPIGLIAQLVDGTLGMGYGVSSSSMLIAAGFLPAVVSASVHAAEIFSSLASGVSHFKLGNVDRKIALPLTAGGVVGGILGASFLSNIDNKLIKPYIGLLLMIIGIKILFTFLKKKSGIKISSRIPSRFLMPLGVVGGAIDAIGGGGWGPICTSTIISARNADPRKTVGSVNAAEFLVTLVITITFAVALGVETFLWYITVPLLIGGVIAAPLSAYACRNVPAGHLGVAIGIILIALNLRVVAPAASNVLGVSLPIKLDLIAALVAVTVSLALVIRSLLFRRAVVGNESRQEA